MKDKIDIISATRKALIKTVLDLSDGQLNRVPSGFNNNIIWNMAHLVATFERVIYLRTGITGPMELSFNEKYKNGTKPEAPASQEEIRFIKESLIMETEQFSADYSRLGAASYDPWKSSAGLQLDNIDDTIDYLAFHEGMHTGCILALKHLV